MSLDLSALSYGELIKLGVEIEALAKARRDEAKAEFETKLAELRETYGQDEKRRRRKPRRKKRDVTDDVQPEAPL